VEGRPVRQREQSAASPSLALPFCSPSAAVLAEFSFLVHPSSDRVASPAPISSPPATNLWRPAVGTYPSHIAIPVPQPSWREQHAYPDLGTSLLVSSSLTPLPAFSDLPVLGAIPEPPLGTVHLFAAKGSPLCASASSLTFVDSGATYHLTGDSTLFVGDMKPMNTPVSGIDSASVLRATGLGSIRACLGGQLATLPNCFYVPGLAHTLISVRALVRAPGASCTFTAAGVCLDLPGLRSPVWAPSTSGLYTLDNFSPSAPAVAEVPLGYYVDVRRRRPQPNTVTGNLSLATLLHRRCGHVSWGNRHLSAAMKEEYGAKFDSADCEFCEHCVMAKMHQFRSGLPSVRKATRPLERVHFDVVFGIPTLGLGANKGFLLLVDEFTDKVFIYYLRYKSEVPAGLKAFQKMAERHFEEALGVFAVPHKLATFRSDNASEQTSAEVRAWLDAEGIRHELSAPYCQWQDGKAERFIKTVWEGSEAMRKAADAPPCYWPFSLRAFVHVHELLPRRNKMSPWEAWNGVSKSLDLRIRHLRVWGTRCFFLIPKALRRKLDDHGLECFFVGYSSTSKAYVGVEIATGRILMSPNVIFDETRYPCRDPGFNLPRVQVGGNIGSNMTELHWVPVPKDLFSTSSQPSSPITPPPVPSPVESEASSQAPNSPSRAPRLGPDPDVDGAAVDSLHRVGVAAEQRTQGTRLNVAPIASVNKRQRYLLHLLLKLRTSLSMRAPMVLRVLTVTIVLLSWIHWSRGNVAMMS
jgi:transposase InsO family protein